MRIRINKNKKIKSTINCLKMKNFTTMYCQMESEEIKFNEGDYAIIDGRFVGKMVKHLKNNEIELKLVELNDDLTISDRNNYFDFVEDEIYGMYDLVKVDFKEAKEFIENKKTDECVSLKINARKLNGKKINIDYLLLELEGVLRCNGYSLVDDIEYIK